MKGLRVFVLLIVFAGALAGASVAAALPASASWVPMDLGSGGPWKDMAFSDADHGWVCGGAVITRTTDGGASWSPQVTLAEGSSIAAVDVADQAGWAVGRSTAGGATDPLILHSSDGGETWMAYDETLLAETPGALTGVDFVDADHGWIWSASGLWITADGGASWAAVASLGPYLSDIQFVDAAHGFAVADGRALRTSDAGATWSAIPGPLPWGWMGECRLAFVDADHGFAFAMNVVGATADGGASWTWRNAPSFWGARLAAVDAQHVWALQEGAVWGSDDAGANWYPRRPVDVWGGSDVALCVTGDRGWVLSARGGARTTLSGFGDMRPPVTTVTGPLIIDETTTYGASATDEGSGVASTVWRLDGGAWSTSPVTVPVPATQTRDSVHSVECYSTDVYGNEEDVNQIGVVVDRAGPTATFSARAPYRLGNWTNKTAYVTLSGDDHQGIGASKVVVRIDGRSPASHPAPWVGTIKALGTHANDGVHTIRMHAVDGFGHAGADGTRSVRIDTRRPAGKLPAKTFAKDGRGVIKFSAQDQKPCSGKYTATFRVLSGSGKLLAQFDPGKTYAAGRSQSFTFKASIPWGIHRLAMTVVDSAGNKDVVYAKLCMNVVTVHLP